jgi:WD40-like Beta Propeller Repeat
MIRGKENVLKHPGRGWTVAIGIVSALLLGLVGWRLSELSSMPRRLTDVYLELAPGESPALAPDRPLLAYVSRHGDDWLIHLRELEGGGVARLRGTEGSRSPFFTSDGRSLAFESSGVLEKTSIDPLDPRGSRWTEIATVGEIRGGSFGDDGTTFFGSDEGIGLVPPSGGEPTYLVHTADAGGARPGFPRPVPEAGNGWVVFDTRRALERNVEAVGIRTGERHRVLGDAFLPRYVDDGALLFVRGNAIWAVRFDPSTARPVGEPMKVVSDVEGGDDAWYDVSRSGTLAFRRPPPGRADGRAAFGVVGNWLTELRRVLPESRNKPGK